MHKFHKKRSNCRLRRLAELQNRRPTYILYFIFRVHTDKLGRMCSPDGMLFPTQDVDECYDLQFLAKKISTVDDLVSKVKLLELENNELKDKLKSLKESSSEMRLLYDSEKRSKEKLQVDNEEQQTRISQLTEETEKYCYNMNNMKMLADQEINTLKQQIEKFDSSQTRKKDKVIEFLVENAKLLHENGLYGGKMRNKFLKLIPVDCPDYDISWIHTEKPVVTKCDKATMCITQTPTVTRSTCTSSFIKKIDVGINVPDDFIAVENILSEIIVDIPEALSPIVDLDLASTSDTAVQTIDIPEDVASSIEPVEMKTIGTMTNLCNIRKRIDFVKKPSSSGIRPSLSTAENNTSFILQNLKKEPDDQMFMPPNNINPHLSSLWTLLGRTIFSLIGNGQVYDNTNMISINEQVQQIAQQIEDEKYREIIKAMTPTPPPTSASSTQSEELPAVSSENPSKDDFSVNRKRKLAEVASFESSVANKKSILIENIREVGEEEEEVDDSETSCSEINQTIAVSVVDENIPESINEEVAFLNNTADLFIDMDVTRDATSSPDFLGFSPGAVDGIFFVSDELNCQSVDDSDISIPEILPPLIPESVTINNVTQAAKIITETSSVETCVASQTDNQEEPFQFDLHLQSLDAPLNSSVSSEDELVIDEDCASSYGSVYEDKIDEILKVYTLTPLIIEPIEDFVSNSSDLIEPINDGFKANPIVVDFTTDSPAEPDEQSPSAAITTAQTPKIIPMDRYILSSSSHQHSNAHQPNTLFTKLVGRYNSEIKNHLTKNIMPPPRNPRENSIIERISFLFKNYLHNAPWTTDALHKICTDLHANCKHPKLLVNTLVDIIESVVNVTPETHTIGQLSPPLPPSHEKTISVIKYFNDYELDEMVIKELEARMFSFASKLTAQQLESLTYFYIGMIDCRQEHSFKLRKFIYKSLYYYGFKSLPMVHAVLTSYPYWIIPKNDDPLYDKSDPLINTIIAVLLSTKLTPAVPASPSESFYKKAELKYFLIKKLRYRFEDNSIPQMIYTLVHQLTTKNSRNVAYCLILIAKRKGTTFGIANIIQSHLVPYLNELLPHISQTNDYDKQIANCLYTISSILKPGDNANDIVPYLNMFYTILQQTEKQIIQEASIEAILRLARYSCTEVYHRIVAWNPTYKISRRVTLMLHSFIYAKTKNFWDNLNAVR